MLHPPQIVQHPNLHRCSVLNRIIWNHEVLFGGKKSSFKMTKVDSLSLFVKFMGISPTTPQFHKFQKSSLDFRRFLVELKKKSKQLMCIARHLVQEATHAFHIATTNGFDEFQVEWPSAAIDFPLIELQRKHRFPQGGFGSAFARHLCQIGLSLNETSRWNPQTMELWKTTLPFELGRLLRWTSRSLLGIFRGCSLDVWYHLPWLCLEAKTKHQEIPNFKWSLHWYLN